MPGSKDLRSGRSGMSAMAYGIPEQAIIEATFVGEIDGQTTMSLFHFRVTEGTSADGATWLLSFIAQLKATSGLRDLYLDCCSQNFTLRTITAQMIWAPNPNVSRRPRVVDVQVDQNGTVEEDSEPSLVSVAITKRTDLAGRKGIGTLHMPAVPITFLQNSVITTTALTAYQHVADELNEAIEVAPISAIPIIMHKGSPSESPVITGATVESTARTMRRRVVGRGI